MKRYRNQRGDTLVEVMLGIAILSLMLAAAFNLGNRSFQVGVAARQRSQVAALMQEQGEALRNWRDSHKFDDLPAGAPFQMKVEPATGEWVVASDTAMPSEPRGNIAVSPVPTADPASIKAYKIEAEWQSPGGLKSTSVLYTHLANIDGLGSDD